MMGGKLISTYMSSRRMIVRTPIKKILKYFFIR